MSGCRLEYDSSKPEGFLFAQDRGTRSNQTTSCDLPVLFVRKAGVGKNTSGDSPALTNAVFKVGEQAHLKIRFDADSVVSLGFGPSDPKDVEQSWR